MLYITIKLNSALFYQKIKEKVNLPVDDYIRDNIRKIDKFL